MQSDSSMKDINVYGQGTGLESKVIFSYQSVVQTLTQIQNCPASQLDSLIEYKSIFHCLCGRMNWAPAGVQGQKGSEESVTGVQQRALTLSEGQGQKAMGITDNRAPEVGGESGKGAETGGGSVIGEGMDYRQWHGAQDQFFLRTKANALWKK